MVTTETKQKGTVNFMATDIFVYSGWAGGREEYLLVRKTIASLPISGELAST